MSKRPPDVGCDSRVGPEPAAPSDPADEEIVIVSGLPRSGTSMMMQMLAAGGWPLLVDDARPPDPSNPRGYFEWAAVKTIERDAAFLDRAPGHAIKIVSPLLRALPDRHRYRVLMMERDLDRVLASQARMLGRGAAETGADSSSLRTAFLKVVANVDAWIADRPNVECLRIAHADVLRDPLTRSATVAEFLGGRSPGEIERMAAAVDPELRHH